MKKTILFSTISFLLGGFLVAGYIYVNKTQPLIAIAESKSSKVTSKSKIVYSTQKTEGYYFPTHNNLLVMDRSNAEVAEVFIVEVASQKHTHKDIHNDTEQLFYVLSGKGKLYIERDGEMENFDLAPTNIVHIPRYVYHQVFCEGSETLRYVAIDCFPNGKNANEPT